MYQAAWRSSVQGLRSAMGSLSSYPGESIGSKDHMLGSEVFGSENLLDK